MQWSAKLTVHSLIWNSKIKYIRWHLTASEMHLYSTLNLETYE